jgi:hypothetical protein
MYKILGITIAVLNTLAALNSTWFFLGLAKVSPIEWFFFNACTPAIALFLLGYIAKDKMIQAMSIPALAFFGLGGMFVFPWTGMNIIAQIGHIMMTCAIAWIIYGIFRDKSFKEATIGLLLAAFIVNAFIAVQQSYVGRHQDKLQQVINWQPK